NVATTSRQLRSSAENLRGAIMDLFWTDERGGYFVLGTDRDSAGRLRQLKVKTSNMGHLLHSRLLAGDDPMIIDRREAVIKQLFSAEMLGLNGIRTLASDEIRYRPGAYHNGSVWIWDNYLISQGLSQLGYHNLAHCINDKLLVDIASTRRFPEYLRGDNDRQRRLNQRTIDVYDHKNKFLNHLEQPPQDVQAWSLAAILSLKLRRASGQHQTVDSQKLALEDSLLGGERLKV
ncbi:MAG: MGH1-like glycoside hydrolase domain-containing protein, partial [Candidatus Saccharimonadales bacterium]